MILCVIYNEQLAVYSKKVVAFDVDFDVADSIIEVSSEHVREESRVDLTLDFRNRCRGVQRTKVALGLVVF